MVDRDGTGIAGIEALVDAWVRGWAVCRGPEVVVRRDGPAWLVHGLGSSRTGEVVLAEPDPGLVAARAAALPERTWLTVVTGEPWSAPVPAGLVAAETHECLMTTDLGGGAGSTGTTAPPADALLVVDGARASVAVQVDGRAAAEGTVAVVGSTAVLDRIRTDDAHRRRGLGSRVVAGLTGWALEQGARTGLLIASPEGRALYQRLGWLRAGSALTLTPAEDPRSG